MDKAKCCTIRLLEKPDEPMDIIFVVKKVAGSCFYGLAADKPVSQSVPIALLIHIICMLFVQVKQNMKNSEIFKPNLKVHLKFHSYEMPCNPFSFSKLKCLVIY